MSPWVCLWAGAAVWAASIPATQKGKRKVLSFIVLELLLLVETTAQKRKLRSWSSLRGLTRDTDWATPTAEEGTAGTLRRGRDPQYEGCAI